MFSRQRVHRRDGSEEGELQPFQSLSTRVDLEASRSSCGERTRNPYNEATMRFLSIVKASENQGPPPQALLDAMAKLTEDSLRDGSLVQTGGLSASSTAARVRISGGKLMVTDGPFAEAKEVVGGYAVLEAKSRAEALEATRQFLQLHQQHWPGWEGECEIRELCFLAP